MTSTNPPTPVSSSSKSRNDTPLAAKSKVYSDNSAGVETILEWPKELIVLDPPDQLESFVPPLAPSNPTSRAHPANVPNLDRITHWTRSESFLKAHVRRSSSSTLLLSRSGRGTNSPRAGSQSRINIVSCTRRSQMRSVGGPERGERSKS